MIPHNRFTKSRDVLGGQLLASATGLKVTLWRDPDGDLSGHYELTGSVGNEEDEKPAETMALMRELLADFGSKGD